MKKLYKILFGILMLSIVLLSGCTGNTAEGTAENSPKAETVSEAPTESAPSTEPELSGEETPPRWEVTFEGTDMEGNTVLSDIFSQSKLTMINVWATYCGPCLSEMPELGELAAEYAPEEFQIIGIISDVLEGEDQSYAESLVEQTGANYTHLLLNESIYYALLTDVTAVPTTFFLDTEGTVLGVAIGSRDKAAWGEIINGLLEKL